MTNSSTIHTLPYSTTASQNSNRRTVNKRKCLEIGFLDGGGELLLRGGPQSIAQRAVGVHAISDSGLRQAAVLQVSSAVLLDSRRKYGLSINAQ